MEADHVTAWSKGGGSELENLTMLASHTTGPRDRWATTPTTEKPPTRLSAFPLRLKQQQTYQMIRIV